MRIGVEHDCLWQTKGSSDLGDSTLAIENAPICEKQELIRLPIERHPPSGRLFVWHVGGNLADPLPLFPNVNVPSGMGQIVAVWFGFVQRSAVGDDLAINQPENAE
jgi:hypothetical protein